MYCTKCGAKLEPNERFCPFCGQTVDDTPEQPASPVPTPPSVPKAPSPQPSTPDPGKGPLNKKLVIVAIVVAILLVAIVAAIFLLGGKEKPDDVAANPSPGRSFGPSEGPTENVLSSQPVETEELPANPSVDPSGEPSEDVSSSQSLETMIPTTAPASLPDLYIGTWMADGRVMDDELNGWQALDVQSVNGNTLTFALESVSAAPFNRIASTYPITVTVEDGKGTFPVNDSWGNSGTGVITVKSNVIHVTVDITSPDMTAMWDIMMDADFYPGDVPSGQQSQPAQIAVMVGGSELSLPQAPYLKNGQVMIPMESVFTAVGIAVFQDGDATVGLTESHAIMLDKKDEDYFELNVDVMGVDWDRSALVHFSNGYHYVPLDMLDVFGLQTDWDAPGKEITIQGTIAASDRTSTEKIEALKRFDKDEAGRRVQDAGYTFAPAGAYWGYWGGGKYWKIPVVTERGTDYSIVFYDGTSYQMNT